MQASAGVPAVAPASISHCSSINHDALKVAAASSVRLLEKAVAELILTFTDAMAIIAEYWPCDPQPNGPALIERAPPAEMFWSVMSHGSV